MRRRSILRVAAFIVATYLVWVGLKTFVVRAFEIPTASMAPTLEVGARVIVDELTPRFTGYHPGDIVVFRDTGGWLGAAARPSVVDVLSFDFDATGYLAKRVIAVAGDTVTGLADGSIKVNGALLDESYAVPAAQPPFRVEVPDGHIWVMGDNRPASADSRVHGPVPTGDVVGRVVFVG